MSKPRQLIGFFIAVFCFALIALAPTSIAGGLIKYASDGHLTLNQSTGSLWRGNGLLQLGTVEGQRHPLGQISWEIAKTPFLFGRLEIALKQTWKNQPGKAQLSLSADQLTLQHMQIHLPAEAIASLSPMLSALAPAGKLQLESESFTLKREKSQRHYQGAITALWQPATFLGGIEAGNYRVQLRGDNTPTLAGDLNTLNGKLELQGKLQINAQNQLIMNGEVRLAPGDDAARLMPIFRALCGQGANACTLGSGLP